MQPLTGDKTPHVSKTNFNKLLWESKNYEQNNKTTRTFKEIKRIKLDIFGVSECRWTDQGTFRYNLHTDIYYSGRSDGRHQEVLVILLSKRYVRINEIG